MRQLVSQLQHAADRHRPGQRQHRRMEVRRGKQRKANHADVEERRGKGRHRETVPGIEDRPHQRGQGDQQNIGEGNAQQLGGQRKFIGGISKPGGGDGDHPRRRQHPDNGDDRQGQGQ